MDEEQFSIEWCIRGYHVYKAIWDAAMGEELPCEREPANLADVCAVAVRMASVWDIYPKKYLEYVHYSSEGEELLVVRLQEQESTLKTYLKED